MTYAMVTDACRVVAGQVRESGWMPGVVVGLSRGGLIPATIIAHQLGVRRACAIDVGFADEARTVIEVYTLPGLMNRPDVLVVDDVVDTGRLLLCAAELLAEFATVVGTAALFRRLSSPSVDFAAQTVEHIPGMPWEVAAL